MIEIAYPAAFAAGLFTFFAPCTFVALPSFLSLLVLRLGKDLRKDSNEYRRQVLLSALSYAFGFLLVFTLLGIGASSLGRLFSRNKLFLVKLGAILIISFGLFELFGEKLGFLKFLYRERRLDFSSLKIKLGYLFPILIGITSAFAWTPCIGPTLGAILLLAGSSTDSASQGALLLFLYGFGITLPFLILAAFLGSAQKFVARFSKYTLIIQKIGAILLILLGLFLLTGINDKIFAVFYRLFIKFGYNPQ